MGPGVSPVPFDAHLPKWSIDTVATRNTITYQYLPMEFEMIINGVHVLVGAPIVFAVLMWLSKWA